MELAQIFFDEWYCENGLPDEVICDRDKLFVSQFWKMLCTLMGIKLRMSSAYHPQTDGRTYEQDHKSMHPLLHE